jgi:hypothetical protein
MTHISYFGYSDPTLAKVIARDHYTHRCTRLLTCTRHNVLILPGGRSMKLRDCEVLNLRDNLRFIRTSLDALTDSDVRHPVREVA